MTGGAAGGGMSGEAVGGGMSGGAAGGGMSGGTPGGGETSACDRCLGRTLLIALLAGHLDHLHADRGMLDEVFALPDSRLASALVPDRAERRRMLDGRDPASLRDAASRARLAVACRHGRGYPPRLGDLDGPPAGVFARGAGRLAALVGEPAVAIVGARRASAYGLEVARSLGRALSACGVTVVSGMALGIDSAAHEGALDAGGRTIAVLGGGADVPYPATKRALYERLAEEAVVLSELPPGFRPRRWTFPARNRIIAALADLTVVIEAAERSGALITARQARELGREVGAVPGRVTSPLAGGPNALLRDGAHLVDGPQAVLDLLFGVGARAAAGRELDDLDPCLREALRAVQEGRDVREALRAVQEGRDAGEATPPAEVLATLGELELRGLVRRAPGGGWVALA